MNEKDIQRQIDELEMQKVDESDCPCFTGLFHDCEEWANDKNTIINLRITILRNSIK